MTQGLSLSIGSSGLAVAHPPALPFSLTPAIVGDTTAFTIQRATLTVSRKGQTRFHLPFSVVPGVVVAVLMARLTRFTPDFSVDGDMLVWQGENLSAGSTFVVEVFGNVPGHLKLEQLVPLADGQIDYILDGVPVGHRIELYIDGRFYGESERIASSVGNRLRWLDASLAPHQGQRVYAFYPRTVEGAGVMHQDAFTTSGGQGGYFPLAIEPRPQANTRVYLDGKRFVGGEFTLYRDQLTLGSPMVPSQGSRLVAVSTPDGTLVPAGPSGDLPARFFIKNRLAIGANGQTAFALPHPAMEPHKAIADLNGLLYGAGFGFDFAGSALTWSALALETPDELTVLGFTPGRVGGGIRITELSVTVGYPTFTLGERAIDINKAVFLISSPNLGGQLFLGYQVMTIVSDTSFQWAGAYPLKSTDRIIAITFRDPLVAEAMEVGGHAVSSGEAGKSLALRLARAPKEPTRAIVTLNGVKLDGPTEFGFQDDVLTYYDTRVRLKTGDLLAWLYH